MTYRANDLTNDREYILECHCRVNYECDTPRARAISYAQYRANWFNMPGQIAEFWGALTESMQDPRTIAELIIDSNGEIAGYFWARFYENAETKFAWLDLDDLYIEERYRRQGLAAKWLTRAEAHARNCGANVLRSGTGCENTASKALQEGLGFYQYRYEFEKVLES